MLSRKEGRYQHTSNFVVFEGSAPVNIYIAAINEDLQQSALDCFSSHMLTLPAEANYFSGQTLADIKVHSSISASHIAKAG